MATNIYLNGVRTIAAADGILNEYFMDVIGNKEDVSNITADQASVIGMLRYVVANLSTDTDVAALIGELTTAAHTGAVDNATTLMGYAKQLITDLIAVKGAGWTNENLTTIDTNIDSILVDTATTIPATIAAVQADLGNPSARTNDQSIEDMIGIPDVAGKDLHTLLVTDRLDNATYGLSALQVETSGLQTDLDNATDGLGALKTLIDANQVDLNAILADVGDFSGQANLQTLLAALAIPDTAGKGLYVELATDRLDDATYGLSALQVLIAALQADLDNGVDGLGALASLIGTVDTVVDGIQTDLSNGTDGLGALKILVDGVKAVADAILVDTGDTGIAGADNNNNTFASTSVVANADGSIIEREEYIQSTLTAGALQTATVTTVDASVTPWTIAAHRLFTITGVVEIDKIFAIVDETVVEGAAADNTCSIGTADDVDLMVGATVGDALVTNDVWANVAGGSLSRHALLANDESFVVSTTDIDMNVLGTNSCTDGTLTFYCTWKPISVGATVVAAVWD